LGGLCVRLQLSDVLLLTLRRERHCRNKQNRDDQQLVQMACSHEQALLRRVSFSRRRQVLGQSPRIAVLLQLVHDIIGNSVAFFFGQFFSKSANKFACTHQCECDSEAQHVPAGAHRWRRTDREQLSTTHSASRSCGKQRSPAVIVNVRAATQHEEVWR